MMQLTRRRLLAGTASVLAAPAILRRRAIAATTLARARRGSATRAR